MRPPFVRVLAPLALAALLSAPTAGAEPDLVPPVSQLFAWNAAPRAGAGPASCGESQAASLARVDARRRAALARIAALMEEGPGGRAEPLNGRGYAYPVQRDAGAELRRVVLEAQRQRAASGPRD